MANSVINETDGTLYRYELGPADLTVHASNSPDRGVTVVWTGRTDIYKLVTFFEDAANVVSQGRSTHCRAWFGTDEGPQSKDFVLGQSASLKSLANASTFIELECLPGQPHSGADSEVPILSIYANRDGRGGTSVDDTPESMSIYMHGRDTLSKLSGDIAATISQTTSRFFPRGRGYDEQLVRFRLTEAYRDIGPMPG
jgi:hypothetical protein